MTIGRHHWILPISVLLVGLAATGCGGDDDSDPAAPPPPPPPPPGGQDVRSAVFQGANGYRTEGSAAIHVEGGIYTLRLGSDFRTDQSSALDVRLCMTTQCGDGDLNLGPIQAHEGAQEYAMPNDGSAYAYVVIWCRAVDLPFGFGILQ